jgi:molybdate transport system ATP-binding protein
VTQPLVQLDNADVTLNGRHILHSISWRLLPGEHWAILGGNGSGKSTLLRLVRGELWPDPPGGRRFYAIDGIAQSSAVGIQQAMPCVSPELQQRYLREERNLSVRQVIESGFEGGDFVYQTITAARRKSAAHLARRVGVAGLLHRDAQELSTGELRRVLIARALAGKPRVLVCDEICDGLDAPARAALLAMLDRLARCGTQLLITTHRPDEVIASITHWLRLEKGRVIGQSDSPPLPPFDVPPLGGPRSDASDLGGRRPAAAGTPNGRARKMKGRRFIHIRNAAVFLGERPVLRDLNWEMREGENWAVVGPNGAGKSTFLRLVVGDLQPAWGGEVKRFEFTSRNTIWEIKRRFGFVSPELQANYREDITGAEVVGSGFFSSVGKTRRLVPNQRARVDALVRQLGLEALANRNARQLSYGEFRKLLLARALVHRPRILVLDEPFDGLDAGSRSVLKGLLERIAAGGTSLLVVTHHQADLPACTSHVACLKNGRLKIRTRLNSSATGRAGFFSGDQS